MNVLTTLLAFLPPSALAAGFFVLLQRQQNQRQLRFVRVRVSSGQRR